ncbi:MAG: hypothetical protein IKK94_02990 [Clostridia bacterium]|nr:hypothetical protein [Clostridia bacterium]
MKKIITALSLFILLISLIFCKEKAPRYDANEFFPLPEKTQSIEIASYDGKRQLTVPYLRREVAKEVKLLDEIMNSLRNTPSEKIENFSHDKIKLPIYGLELDPENEVAFHALFSNGYLLTQDGEVYKFDYDFAALMEKDFPVELIESELDNFFPGLRLAADNNGKWAGDFMPDAVIKPTAHYDSLDKKEGVSLEIKRFDDLTAYGIIHNDNYELLEYGEFFDLHALVDGKWKLIPWLEEVYFPDVGYESSRNYIEMNFHLGLFAPLPKGRYRIIFDGLIAEFDIE